MKIESLYRDYIQKSKLFLYPLLDIKRGVSITPMQTFMAWDTYTHADFKFICQYHLRDDPEFKVFEAVKLIGSPFYHSNHLLEDGTCIYIFDFTKLEIDFWHIVTGKYSKLSKESKRKITTFFKNSNTHSAYINSYLEPKQYYHMYSEILAVDIKYFKMCGELCSKPDLDLETLKLNKKVTTSNNNPLNLHL